VSRFLPAVVAIGVLGLILSYQNCGSQKLQGDPSAIGIDAKSGQVVIQGTLEKSAIDGCRYLLRSDDGQYFIPVKLASEFQQEGANLLIEGTLREDIVTTCMGGTVLQVDKAQAAP
jgi:hypothetical protein